MHIATRFAAIRWRANKEPELAIVIADVLGWEAIEVDELLAGDFDPLPAEAKMIAYAVADFDLKSRFRARLQGNDGHPHHRGLL